jgi:hypothetical protein
MLVLNGAIPCWSTLISIATPSDCCAAKCSRIFSDTLPFSLYGRVPLTSSKWSFGGNPGGLARTGEGKVDLSSQCNVVTFTMKDYRMKDRVLNEAFSVSGASFAIGAIGFLAALVTMFVNVNEQISVKWLLFVIWLSISFILILMKVIHGLTIEKKPPPSFENPIRYIAEEQVFLIRRNENFLNNIIVGCYLHINEIDKLAYLAVVHIVQEKVIQIKIHTDMSVLAAIPTLPDELKTIIVRPVVPVTALQHYQPGASR